MWFVQRPVITKRRQTPPQIENKWGGISLLRLVQVMSHLTCRVMFFFVCLPLCWPRQLHEHDKEFPHVQCGIELCACVLHSDLSKPLFSLTVSMCSIDVQRFSLHDHQDSVCEMSHADWLCPSPLLLCHYSSVVQYWDSHVLSLDLSVSGLLWLSGARVCSCSMQSTLHPSCFTLLSKVNGYSLGLLFCICFPSVCA